MHDITILAVGGIKSSAIQFLCETYMKRLAPFARVRLVEARAESFTTDAEKKKSKRKEGERVCAIAEKEEKRGASIFLLDERGKEMTSYEFSEFLEKHSSTPMVFIIGGALGFSEELYSKNYEHIALSRFTFPHEFARVLLFEQLYRGITLAKGKTYHY